MLLSLVLRRFPLASSVALIVLLNILGGAAAVTARAEVLLPEQRPGSPVLQDELNQQLKQKQPADPPDVPPGSDMNDCVHNDDPQLRIVACTHAIEGHLVSGDQLAAAYFNRAIGYTLIAKYDAAMRDFGETLKLKPGLPVAYIERGKAEMRANRPVAAKQDFDAAIAKDPDNVDARYLRAWLESTQNQDAQAVADLNDVLAKHPDHFDALLDRGGLLIRDGKFDGAIRDFSAMLKIDPKSAAAFYNRGRAKSAKGDFAGAAEDFAGAMKAWNDNPYAALRLNLARKFQAQSKQKGGNAAGDPAALKAAADKLLDAQWPVQIVNYFQNKMDAAAIFKLIDSDYPRQAPSLRCEINYYLGQAALLKGDRKAAGDYFTAAVATDSLTSIEYIDSNLALKALGK
ncbi:MAG: tetratricopeptide repeat protein [Dongiaceae bacterium]